MRRRLRRADFGQGRPHAAALARADAAAAAIKAGGVAGDGLGGVAGDPTKPLASAETTISDSGVGTLRAKNCL